MVEKTRQSMAVLKDRVSTTQAEMERREVCGYGEGREVCGYGVGRGGSVGWGLVC